MTMPAWFADTAAPQPASLGRDVGCDVCVIGAGIAGLTAAYLLVEAGKDVIVIDDGDIASGESGRTTAHLTTALDDRYFEIERIFGKDGARIAAESHAAAIALIERIQETERIDCGFTRLDGYLFLAEGNGQELLEKELQAASEAGLDVGIVKSPLPRIGRSLRFANQAQIHPLKYLHGLARAVVGHGGRIYARTHAAEVKRGEVITHSGTVHADHIVIATNAPIHESSRTYAKQAPYRTYVIGARLRRRIAPALYWDTGDPYHYVRMQGIDGKDYIIVGGEDHKTGHEDDAQKRYARLERWTRTRFSIGKVEFRWSGQVMEPADGMAFIGEDQDGICIITGDSGNGMTHGSLAGIIVRDIILGMVNPWAKLYDPHRIPMTKDMLKENADVARQLTKKITGGSKRNEAHIRAGEGMVLRERTQKIACYRDEHGELHKVSAVCTHMGCIVSWNSGERSWDCPCHGSRFGAGGDVLNGPARHALDTVDARQATAPAAHSATAAPRRARR